MKGIVVNNNEHPRSLKFNDEQVATGGENLQGLSAQGDNLLFDGKVIATSSDRKGLHVQNGVLYFGDVAIMGGVVPPPIEPDEPSEPEITSLWLPPTQEASTYTPYSYSGLIERYDALMSRHSSYISKATYTEHGYGDYPLVSYTLTPQNYTKTMFLQAGIHGNEHDAPQTLLRIVEILCDHVYENAYSVMRPLRENVRFVIIPCVFPWGWDNLSMNRPYENLQGDSVQMNMNRNLDFNHQYYLAAAGTGGNYPWQVPETRHIKSVLESIGYENIDYAIDYHDGGDVKQHFWINYNMDSDNAPVVRKLVADLVDYEEKNYPQYKDSAKGWVNTNCCDAGAYSTGVASAFWNYSTGILASVCEYIGGYFGYNFDAEQMTRSLRIRANMLLYAYGITTKGWTINEENGATRFRFDTPRTMTRQGLREDATDTTMSQTQVTHSEVYARWDALSENYPSIVRKSASLGKNNEGNEVYYYTIGNGAKKVLFVGGSLRWGAAHKETEFGAYTLAENLCSDYLVAQSALLQQLRDNYTIVVLPCININAGGNVAGIREIGLNNMALSYKKWELVNDICQPTSYAQNTAKDIPILLSFFNAHQDARLILSGGEDTSGYAFEEPKYNMDYMTQFILPKKMQTPSWLTDFAAYLESERKETTPDIISTDGKTFADYVFDNLSIPALYLNLQLDGTWDARKQYSAPEEKDGNGSKYFYRSYETGRRLAAIVNIMLSI